MRGDARDVFFPRLSLVARGKSRNGSPSQAKTPAPQRHVNGLRSLWSWSLACGDLCHGLLA